MKIHARLPDTRLAALRQRFHAALDDALDVADRDAVLEELRSVHARALRELRRFDELPLTVALAKSEAVVAKAVREMRRLAEPKGPAAA